MDVWYAIYVCVYAEYSKMVRMFPQKAAVYVGSRKRSSSIGFGTPFIAELRSSIKIPE